MILLDTFESLEFEDLLTYLGVEVARYPLNEKGMADLWWRSPTTGLSYQWEHKQVTEIINNYEHVEGQLKKQYPNADASGLIIRCVADPLYSGLGAFNRQSLGSKYFRMNRRYDNASYYTYRTWLDGLDAVSIRVVEVPSLEAVAYTIAAIYRGTIKQPDERKTFKRYLRTKIELQVENPDIKALMALSLVYGLGIGEVRATALVERFGTFLGVLRASEGNLTQVAGISKGTATKLKEWYNGNSTPE